MKRVSYSGQVFLTGDAVADALLEYAAVLARAGQADRVTVPGIGEGGRVTRFDLLVGPASQIIAEAVEHLNEDLVDEALIADLEVRGRRARAGRIGEGHDGT